MSRSARKQGLTLLVPLGARHAESLGARLKMLADPFRVSFSSVRSLHFARLGVVPAAKGADLVLETTFEGEPRAHFLELWGSAAPLFRELSTEYGLPLSFGSGDDFARFTARYARRAALMYVSTPAEPAGGRAAVTPDLVRSRLLRELPGVLALTPWFELDEQLRRAPSRAEMPVSRATEGLSSSGQMPFVAVFLRRPGRLRERAFGRVLDVLHGLLEGGASTLQRFGPGGLAALHTARWVLLPDERVLFSAVVEGPVSTFFDRLVETASVPVSAACMHLEGFPATRALHFGGTRSHAAFRRWLAAHQVEPGVCYAVAPEQHTGASSHA